MYYTDHNFLHYGFFLLAIFSSAECTIWCIVSYLVALSLEQEQGEVAGSDVWLGSEAAVLSE